MKINLKSIWKNRKLIFEGITNTIIRDKVVEEIAELRYNICDECEFKGDDCAVPGTSPCCNECGCSLAFKTRALAASCPKGKWKAVLTEEQEEELENLKD
jgi:hypothetical protein